MPLTDTAIRKAKPGAKPTRWRATGAKPLTACRLPPIQVTRFMGLYWN